MQIALLVTDTGRYFPAYVIDVSLSCQYIVGKVGVMIKLWYFCSLLSIILTFVCSGSWYAVLTLEKNDGKQ